MKEYASGQMSETKKGVFVASYRKDLGSRSLVEIFAVFSTKGMAEAWREKCGTTCSKFGENYYGLQLTEFKLDDPAEIDKLSADTEQTASDDELAKVEREKEELKAVVKHIRKKLKELDEQLITLGRIREKEGLRECLQKDYPEAYGIIIGGPLTPTRENLPRDCEIVAEGSVTISVISKVTVYKADMNSSGWPYCGWELNDRYEPRITIHFEGKRRKVDLNDKDFAIIFIQSEMEMPAFVKQLEHTRAAETEPEGDHDGLYATGEIEKEVLFLRWAPPRMSDELQKDLYPGD